MLVLLLVVLLIGLVSWAVDKTTAPSTVKLAVRVFFIVPTVVLAVRCLEQLGIKVL